MVAQKPFSLARNRSFLALSCMQALKSPMRTERDKSGWCTDGFRIAATPESALPAAANPNRRASSCFVRARGKSILSISWSTLRRRVIVAIDMLGWLAHGASTRG